MMSTTHVFGVVFPGAGHAINFFNVAGAIANPSLIVHALVMSETKAKRWLDSTVQLANPLSRSRSSLTGNGSFGRRDLPAISCRHSRVLITSLQCEIKLVN